MKTIFTAAIVVLTGLSVARAGTREGVEILLPMIASNIGAPMLVPLRSGDHSDKQIREIVADMAVLQEILANNLSEAFPQDSEFEHGLGMKPLYLGEDGIALLLSVPFPLSGSSEGSAREPSSDEVWEQMRREMGIAPPIPAEPYEAEKVERLEAVVKSTLKHAHNIRHLGPTASVAVMAFGGSDIRHFGPTASSLELRRAVMAFGGKGHRVGAESEPHSAMTFRAAMNDLENLSVRIDTWGDSPVLEDVAVMARVLHTGLRDKFKKEYHHHVSEWWMPSHFNFPHNVESGVQGLYIDGFGALFYAGVAFPVAGKPGEIESDEQDEQMENSDDVWEQARREVHGKLGGASGRWADEQGVFAHGDSPVKYDETLVESLKDVVIDGLKYASRMRDIAPDESVVVAVRGTSRGDMLRGALKRVAGRGKSFSARVFHISTGQTSIAFRATKRDIDRYASGSLSRDAFAEKVEISTNYAK